MILLPEFLGFARPGEKCTKDKVLICTQCGSKRTVHTGKYVPECSKCKEQTYWYEAVSIERA